MWMNSDRKSRNQMRVPQENPPGSHPVRCNLALTRGLRKTVSWIVAVRKSEHLCHDAQRTTPKAFAFLGRTATSSQDTTLVLARLCRCDVLDDNRTNWTGRMHRSACNRLHGPTEIQGLYSCDEWDARFSTILVRGVLQDSIRYLVPRARSSGYPTRSLVRRRST
jgi:hypothetical protein